MKFCFGDIVVVERNLIGVVVKDWQSLSKEPHHEVYVRYFNEIKEYSESQMERYMVRHKYLSDEEIIWQDNAVNNRDTEVAIKGLDLMHTMMRTVEETLEEYECPTEYLEKLTNALNSKGIFVTRDLMKVTPEALASIRGMSKFQYSFLVATIINIHRKHCIKSDYTMEEYLDTKYKKGDK